MRQFLSNTATLTVVRMRKGPYRVASKLRKRSKALVVMMMGFASPCIVAGYLAQEHPTVGVLSSLLIGFAPLIGLGVLLIIVALLISFLIIEVEQTLADEDDGIVPEPHLKSKWHRVAPCLSDQLARCLSLKEHSPPALRFS